jgi:hypothetical protein
MRPPAGDAREARGEAEPGQGVAQVIIGDVLRQGGGDDTGRRGLFGFHRDNIGRRPADAAEAGERGDSVQVDDARLDRAVLAPERGAVDPRPGARGPKDAHGRQGAREALGVRGHAAGQVLDDAPVQQDCVKRGRGGDAAEGEQPPGDLALAQGVAEHRGRKRGTGQAGDAHAPELDRRCPTGGAEHLFERPRRSVLQRRDPGDEALLPFQPLELPLAQPDEHGDADQGADRQTERKTSPQRCVGPDLDARA